MAAGQRRTWDRLVHVCKRDPLSPSTAPQLHDGIPHLDIAGLEACLATRALKGFWDSEPLHLVHLARLVPDGVCGQAMDNTPRTEI